MPAAISWQLEIHVGDRRGLGRDGLGFALRLETADRLVLKINRTCVDFDLIDAHGLPSMDAFEAANMRVFRGRRKY
jgi:hypothetical protein